MSFNDLAQIKTAYENTTYQMAVSRSRAFFQPTEFANEGCYKSERPDMVENVTTFATYKKMARALNEAENTSRAMFYVGLGQRSKLRMSMQAVFSNGQPGSFDFFPFFLLKSRLQSHFVAVNCGVFWWWD